MIAFSHVCSAWFISHDLLRVCSESPTYNFLKLSSVTGTLCRSLFQIQSNKCSKPFMHLFPSAFNSFSKRYWWMNLEMNWIEKQKYKFFFFEFTFLNFTLNLGYLKANNCSLYCNCPSSNQEFMPFPSNQTVAGELFNWSQASMEIVFILFKLKTQINHVVINPLRTIAFILKCYAVEVNIWC